MATTFDRIESNGYGVRYIWKGNSRWRYEGEHRNGHLWGYGVWYSVDKDLHYDGASRYEGEWVNGAESGYGVETGSSFIYEGQMGGVGERKGWGYEVDNRGTIRMGFWDGNELVRPARPSTSGDLDVWHEQ